MNGSLGVISDLNKLDVYQVAKWYNKNFEKIPLNSILKPPSAELSKNQIDPYDYEIISPIVDLIIEDNRFTLEEIKKELILIMIILTCYIIKSGIMNLNVINLRLR